MVKPFDWSYSTDYKGTVKPGSLSFQPSDKPIPLELLKKPDPILFFDEVMLYEDEMADNGITMLSCKIRVMPKRLLLLCRFFMRLDNVLIRIRDTRFYIEFESGELIREYTAREEKYEVVRQVSNENSRRDRNLSDEGNRAWHRKVKMHQRNCEILTISAIYCQWSRKSWSEWKSREF